MNEEQAFEAKESIISRVEEVVESGHYTLQDIVDDIEDRLCHLTPEQENQ